MENWRVCIHFIFVVFMKMKNIAGFLLILTLTTRLLVRGLEARDIVIVVLSQGDSYHAYQAQTFRNVIVEQAKSLNTSPPTVSLIHEDFPQPGAWTVIPILPILQKLYGSNSSWIVFCEEKTHINLKEMVQLLDQHNSKDLQWIGYALHDNEPSIIHHFAFADNPQKFKYPLFATGFAMSTALLNGVAVRAYETQLDFSIDASHEFALFVGVPLKHLPSKFCLRNETNCSSYPTQIYSCGDSVSTEDIYFAVKTCLKFHRDRVPVVKQTWGLHAKHIEFFSDHQDDSIPTTAVGVANTERGHCSKMLAIFKIILQRMNILPNLQWLVVADDDTLLSVPRLQNLLSCWNRESIVIGERYGFNVVRSAPGGGHTSAGYNYLTGGGGFVVSTTVLPILVQHCHCQSDDSPDDMYLGFCLSKLNIPIVHSPLFHQARPADYAGSYLAVQQPVSFHKHWMLDPVATYKEWFASADDASTVHTSFHTEL